MGTPVVDGLFSDEVFTATELNRRVGTVLDHAWLKPVTISRNNELFALLKREDAARMISTITQMKMAFGFLSEAHRALIGESVAPQFSWLKIYDKDDLQRLFSEVFSAVGKATSGAGDWNEVQAVIHEWKESALVAESGVLDDAVFRDAVEEIPLCHPDAVLQYQAPLPLTEGQCPESTNPSNP